MTSSLDDVLVVVPARGGSKRLPGKNLLSVAGKSLVQHAVEVGLAVSDLVVVSSDDPAILQEGRRAGACAERRSARLASDSASTLDVVLSLLDRFPDQDTIVVLQPTSPLRSVSDVRRCLEKLNEGPSVTSVTALEHPAEWIVDLDPQGRIRVPASPRQLVRRQAAPPRYRLNGAVYCVRREWLAAGNPLVGTGTIGVPMPAKRSIDIDTAFDFALADLIAAGLGDDLGDDE